MKRTIVTLAGLAAAVMTQGSRASPAAFAAQPEWVVPQPIAGGDFFPDLPHHRAGIIHSFYPIDTALGGDGVWAEPNEMTDFKGYVAQVFMGGNAVDNLGNQYVVDVDNRVYRGEYIGTNGERAWGTFCEI